MYYLFVVAEIIAAEIKYNHIVVLSKEINQSVWDLNRLAISMKEKVFPETWSGNEKTFYTLDRPKNSTTTLSSVDLLLRKESKYAFREF